MSAEKVVQIAVSGNSGDWGTLYALTESGQMFCLETTSMKSKGNWILIDPPDFDKNVKLREDQEG